MGQCQCNAEENCTRVWLPVGMVNWGHLWRLVATDSPDIMGKLTSLSLDIEIVYYLAFLLLPSSLISLFFSVARNVPFKVKSDQGSSQLKTCHWFSFKLKLQMFPLQCPTWSSLFNPCPTLFLQSHLLMLSSIHSPAATWASFFLEHFRPTPDSGSLHLLLPLLGTLFSTYSLGSLPHLFPVFTDV